MSKDLGSRSSVRSLRDITRVDYKSLHQDSHYPGCMSDNEIYESATGGQADSIPLQGASGGPGEILIPGNSPRAETRFGNVDVDGVDDEFLAMQREMHQLKDEEVRLKREWESFSDCAFS